MVLWAIPHRYDKLLSLVEMAKQYPLVHNLSAEVTTAAQEILQVVSEESAPIKRIDCSNLSKQRALQYLEGNLMHKQTPQAVSLLHGEPWHTRAVAGASMAIAFVGSSPHHGAALVQRFATPGLETCLATGLLTTWTFLSTSTLAM